MDGVDKFRKMESAMLAATLPTAVHFATRLDCARVRNPQGATVLQKRTVLVLGAGASVDFNFPTGVGLSKQIFDQTAYGAPGHEHLASQGFGRDFIESFRNAFFYSGKNSIDAFLEHNEDFSDVGKAAISSVLGRCETPEDLFKFENNWLRYLYGQLNTSFEEFGNHPLSIITYNYDRAVETFLFTALKYTYHRADEECIEVLNKLPIVHLHGSLGPLPWQRPAWSSPYSPEPTPEKIKVGVKSIKIIHAQPTDRDNEFRQARELLKNADRVLFMGFGYDKTNLERLDLSTNLGPKVAFGTCIGLSNAEKERANGNAGGKLKLVAGNCLDFVKDRIPWRA